MSWVSLFLVSRNLIDGGWILHSFRWKTTFTWKDIAESYLQVGKSMGSQCLRITVVFTI